MTSSLAAQGFQIMAVTGIFSGQLFNFLMGLCLSSIYRALIFKGSSFDLFGAEPISSKENVMMLTIFISLLVHLVYLGFKITKINGYSSIILKVYSQDP